MNISKVDEWLAAKHVPDLQTCVSFGEEETGMVSAVST